MEVKYHRRMKDEGLFLFFLFSVSCVAVSPLLID